jgi:hypothetical protein
MTVGLLQYPLCTLPTHHPSSCSTHTMVGPCNLEVFSRNVMNPQGVGLCSTCSIFTSLDANRFYFDCFIFPKKSDGMNNLHIVSYIIKYIFQETPGIVETQSGTGTPASLRFSPEGEVGSQPRWEHTHKHHRTPRQSHAQCTYLCPRVPVWRD